VKAMEMANKVQVKMKSLIYKNGTKLVFSFRLSKISKSVKP
jgi:hypothetical protein